GHRQPGFGRRVELQAPNVSKLIEFAPGSGNGIETEVNVVGMQTQLTDTSARPRFVRPGIPADGIDVDPVGGAAIVGQRKWRAVDNVRAREDALAIPKGLRVVLTGADA